MKSNCSVDLHGFRNYISADKYSNNYIRIRNPEGPIATRSWASAREVLWELFTINRFPEITLEIYDWGRTFKPHDI